MPAPSIPPAVEKASHVDNKFFANLSILVPLGVAGVVFFYNLIVTVNRRLRRAFCVNDDRQAYFRRPNWHALFKRVLYLRLSSWLYLLGIVGMNIAFLYHGMQRQRLTLLLHLRNRAGSLAVANLTVLFLLGGRNNPLIRGLNVSFGTFNLLHRWYGRIVLALSVVHVVCELLNMKDSGKKAHMSGYTVFAESLKEARFILFGLVAWVSFLTILVTSIRPIRHAFYETFLHIHVCLVALALAGLWIHLRGNSTLIYVQVATAFWIVERVVRIVRVMYWRTTTATIEHLSDAVRVTLPVSWNFRPGQHVFLSIPAIGLWTNHPFSVAWAQVSQSSESGVEKALPPLPPSVSLVLRRRSGFTDRLFTSGRTSLTAYIEGPYGLGHSLTSYGTVVMFAGGIGVTHMIGYCRTLLEGYIEGTCAVRKVLLVWSVQKSEHLEWIRPWVEELMAMPFGKEILRIQVHVTRERNGGRPDVAEVLDREVSLAIGAVGVSVCGPSGLAKDVRRAVRRELGKGRVELDLVEEEFGW